MLAVIGAVLPFAVGVAVSPLPPVAVVLILLSPRGRAAGAAFLFGRIVCVAVVVGIFAAISDVIERTGTVSPLMAVVRIVVGIALIVLAVRKWGGRPGGDAEPKLPAWMSVLDNSSPGKGFGFAALLSVNPKELLLNVGAGLTIGDAALPIGPTLGAAAIYTVIACLGAIVPVVAFLIAAERMRAPLDAARSWLVRNIATITSVVLLVIGAVLIGGGLGDL